MAELRPLHNPVAFCLRGLEVEPHPGQARWLLDNRPVRVLAAGRRSGKSWSLAAELVYHAAGPALRGEEHRQFVIAPSVDQCRVIFGYLEALLKDSALGGLVTKQVRTPFPLLELNGCAVITARSVQHEGRGLRGWSAQRVVVDEAAFVPARVIEEVIGPMLADTGGSLTLASTPWGRRGKFYEFFLRGQDPAEKRYSAHRFPSTDNPHLDASYLEAQRRELPEQIWQAEYLAEFVDDQGAVFPWEHIEAGMVGREEKPLTGASYLLGWDPAQYHDRSAVVVLRVDTEPARVVHVVDLAGQDYTEQVAEVVALAGRFNSARVIADQTAHGDPLVSMLRERGLTVEGVKFTPASKREMIFTMVAALERRAVVFPPHRDLIDELRWYQAEVTPSGNVKLGAPAGARYHDDFTTAFALAWWGHHRSKRCEPLLMPFTSRDLGVPAGDRPGLVQVPDWLMGGETVYVRTDGFNDD